VRRHRRPRTDYQPCNSLNGHTKSATPSSSCFAGDAVPDGLGDPRELDAIGEGG
jgi:hypothetical protein